MGLLKKFFNQTRKPEGFLGKIMVAGMNGGSHAKLANFGLALVGGDFRRIADLGCGGGRNVGELLTRYPTAHVTGIDYSAVSVEKAQKRNQKFGERCEIRQGDVSKLDLPLGEYDLATAFETVYFWPGLEKCFSNVYGALKSGGLFLITNESDGLDETGRKFEKIIDGMKVYTADEICAALEKVGFEIVKSAHHDKNPWIAVLAKKP
ncbi:MAG: class I SAM-dependent methyltransferase [Clostridia bacterium]|nr:class I SAM-dependent methyltransferase [Clostridia bacterium]